MATFIHLSDRIINLGLVQQAVIESDTLTVMGSGFSAYLHGEDIQRLRAALQASRWLPPGEPGPLGSEALGLVRMMVRELNVRCALRQADAREHELLEKGKALLARARREEQAPEPLEGDPD